MVKLAWMPQASGSLYSMLRRDEGPAVGGVSLENFSNLVRWWKWGNTGEGPGPIECAC